MRWNFFTLQPPGHGCVGCCLPLTSLARPRLFQVFGTVEIKHDPFTEAISTNLNGAYDFKFKFCMGIKGEFARLSISLRLFYDFF